MNKLILISIITASINLNAFDCGNPVKKTEDEIREHFVKLNQIHRTSSCQCPEDVDSIGRRCGARSTHDKSGFVCYKEDVSEMQILAYKNTCL